MSKDINNGNGNLVVINLKAWQKKLGILASIVVILVGIITIWRAFDPPKAVVDMDLVRAEIRTEVKNVLNQSMNEFKDTLSNRVSQEIKKHVNDEGAHKWIIRELRDNDLSDIRREMKSMYDRQQFIINLIVANKKDG